MPYISQMSVMFTYNVAGLPMFFNTHAHAQEKSGRPGRFGDVMMPPFLQVQTVAEMLADTSSLHHLHGKY